MSAFDIGHLMGTPPLPAREMRCAWFDREDGITSTGNVSHTVCEHHALMMRMEMRYLIARDKFADAVEELFQAVIAELQTREAA